MPEHPGPNGAHAPQHARPSMRSFLLSRFLSANGALAAVYLALSAWIYRNPALARRIWRRMTKAR